MKSKTCLLLLFFLALPIVGYAQSGNDPLVRELYIKSGMEKQMAGIPAVMQARFSQTIKEDANLRKLPKEVVSVMSGLIGQSFAPELMNKSALAEIAGKLTVKEMKEVLQWLDSPLGKKCTQLEEAASTPEGMAAVEKFASSLKESPPAKDRLEAVRDLDAAVKGTESAVELAVQTQVAVALAIVATFPAEKRVAPDAIAREVEKMRPAMEANVRAEVLSSDLYTYQSLTVAELQRCAAFANSPAGVKYYKVTISAFKKSFIEGAVRWGKLIGDALQDAKKNTRA